MEVVLQDIILYSSQVFGLIIYIVDIPNLESVNLSFSFIYAREKKVESIQNTYHHYYLDVSSLLTDLMKERVYSYFWKLKVVM